MFIKVETPAGTVGRVYAPMSYLPDISCGVPVTRKSIEDCLDPDAITTDRKERIDYCCDLHGQYVSNETSLRSIAGSEQGNTVLLVGAGPSAKGVADRIDAARARGLKVCTLNLGTTFIHNPDYVACYERLAKPVWWKRINPEKTKLLCAPLAPREALDVWKDARNVYYSWIADMRNATDPRWSCLDPLIGGLTTGTCAVHALHTLGFKNILLVGFDFSIGDVGRDSKSGFCSGKFYADGTDATAEGCYVRKRNQLLAEGINGRECLINDYQLGHAMAMKAACQIVMGAGTNVVNCCGQGVLDIEKPMKLSDLGLKGDERIVTIRSQMVLEAALDLFLPETTPKPHGNNGHAQRLVELMTAGGEQ